MTEFCEAVAYAIYCVGLEGLHTSLKPAEALIYLYDGRTNLRHPDHTTIIEVDESLFWLQTSVQAFSTNAIES